MGFTQSLNIENRSGLNSYIIAVLTFGIGIGLLISSASLATISLFIDRYESHDISRAIIYSGLIGLVTSYIYSYFQRRVSYARLSSIALLLIIASCFFIRAQFMLGNDKIIYVSFVWLLPVVLLSITVFSGMQNTLFDIRDAKRYSSVLAAGLVLSSVIFLTTFPFLNQKEYLNVRDLYTISGYSGVFALTTLVVLVLKYYNLRELNLNLQYISHYNSTFRLAKNRYFIWLSLFIFFATVVLWLVDYTFLYVVNEQHQTLEETAGFLSWFGAAIIPSAFLIQLFASKKLIRQYGIRISLLILPILLGLSVLLSWIVANKFGHTIASDTFFLFFIIVVAIKVISFILKWGIQDNIFRFYFLPIEPALRFDTQTKIEAGVRFLATCSTGWLLLYLANYNEKIFLATTIATVCLVAFWIFSTFGMYASYRKILERNLGKQQGLIKHEASLSEGFIEQLRKDISKSRYANCIYRLNLLKILDPIIHKQTILQLLDNEDERIQEAVLLEASNLYLLEAIPVLEKIMEGRYFPVLKNAGLIKKVCFQLKGAAFRLEKIKYIEQLTLSKLINERIYGALLTTYADQSMKIKLLSRLFRDQKREVKYYALLASAGTENSDLHNNLVEKINDTFYGNAAVSAIAASGEHFFKMLESAFYLSGQDQKTQLRTLQVYGQVSTELAVNLLLKKLNHPNQNIVAAALNALSRCGFTVSDESQALQIRAELENVCSTLIWNMSVYLDLHREKCSDILLQAIAKEIDNNYQTIFRLLALIYDPKSVELVKKNINSRDVEESEFASELLEVFIKEEMKPVLIPILKVSFYEEKVNHLQNFFPTEPMKKEEALANLVQRDYKWINRWTKTCALRELAGMQNVDCKELLASNIVNPDPILRETSAEAMLKLYPDCFEELAERYQTQPDFKFAIETMQKIKLERNEGKNNLPVLKFEVVQFLNNIEEFKYIPGLVLSEIAKNLEMLICSENEVVEESSLHQMNFYLLFKGNVHIKMENGDRLKYQGGEMIHNLNWVNNDFRQIVIEAKEPTVLFRLNKDVFSELISFYDEIPDSIVKVLDNKEREIKKHLVLN